MNTHRTYTIQEYTPEWKERFHNAEKVLRPVFGNNLIEIEHIGSTAVEGMWAKPQVDILAVVKKLDLVRNVYSDLVRAGCTIHGKGYVAVDDEYLSIDSPEGTRLVSIHTIEEGNPKIEEYRVFRDYLNAHLEERRIYTQKKRELFIIHKDSYPEYYQGKKTLLEEILERAFIWSKNNTL